VGAGVGVLVAVPVAALVGATVGLAVVAAVAVGMGDGVGLAVGVAVGGRIGSLSVALLLLGLESSTPGNWVTIAALVSTPLAPAAIVASTVMRRLPPGWRSTKASTFPTPLGGVRLPSSSMPAQLALATGVQVHVAEAISGGNRSSTNPNARVGPALVTVIVYMVWPPAITLLALFVLVSARSRES
jgi:hypothetical protein